MASDSVASEGDASAPLSLRRLREGCRGLIVAETLISDPRMASPHHDSRSLNNASSDHTLF